MEEQVHLTHKPQELVEPTYKVAIVQHILDTYAGKQAATDV